MPRQSKPPWTFTMPAGLTSKGHCALQKPLQETLALERARQVVLSDSSRLRSGALVRAHVLRTKIESSHLRVILLLSFGIVDDPRSLASCHHPDTRLVPLTRQAMLLSLSHRRRIVFFGVGFLMAPPSMPLLHRS